MYTLQWLTPSIDTNKGTAIPVPVGTVVSDKASVRFTGKGAANYGGIQQENLMRLLENSAGPTAPAHPTVGELWFDSATSILRLCDATSPVHWKALAGLQITNVGDATPTPAVLGDIWVKRTGSASVQVFIYTGLGRHPQSGNTLGGWEQIWPTVEIVAGREEYNSFLTSLNALVGPTSGGGNAAIGKVIQGLTNFTALDTNLHTLFAARTPLDENVLTPTTEVTTELLVDPISLDWDKILAGAKYAVNRLDLPANFVDDICPVPFITDGRAPDSTLMALSTSDVRYPTLERRSNRKFGIVTLVRAYAETMNILTAAAANRYSLKGINGSTGTNTTFGSNTQVAHHVIYSGPVGGATSVTNGVKFNFASQEIRNTWLYSGGAIQFTLSHVPGGSGTAADTNLKTLLDSRGVIRVTVDKARVFANTLPLTLAVSPAGPGFTGSGAFTVTTQTVGAATYTVFAQFPTTTSMNTTIVMSGGGGAMNGTLTLTYDVIKDIETYSAPATTLVYGAPTAYASIDRFTATPASIVFVS